MLASKLAAAGHLSIHSAIMRPRLICEIPMRRLFLVLCLLLAVPAMAAGLLDNRPSSTLGAINNSNDFLPVRDAFRLNLIDTTPETIKLRFVPTEGYYLYRHKFAFKTEPADIALGTPQLPKSSATRYAWYRKSRNRTVPRRWLPSAAAAWH